MWILAKKLVHSVSFSDIFSLNFKTTDTCVSFLNVILSIGS